MPVRIQTVTAGNSFDGTAGAGLFDWTAATSSDLPLPVDSNVRPTILSLAVECDADVPTLFCRFQRVGEAITSLNRITIRRPSTAARGFSLAGCKLQVPREDDGLAWLLVLTSGILTADATFVVDYVLGGSPLGWA